MSTGGLAGYFGYEYQFHVSALLALLAYAERPDDFTAIKIETVFGQDAAIGINDPEPLDVRSLALEQQFGGEAIQVQIKSRGRGDQWQHADVRDMLLKQSEAPADGTPPLLIDLLAEKPNSHFLFVTNGVVSGQLSSLLIPELTTILDSHQHDKIEETRIALARPSDVLRDRLTSQVLSRVAMVDGLSLNDIQLRMGNILIQKVGVPVSEVTPAIQRLLQMVRDAALRHGRDEITNGDLATLLRPVDEVPYPTTDQHLVETEHLQAALTRLADSHILVVTGEPASGKTTLAQAIANALAKGRYLCREVTGVDAYREILAECQGANNTLCILNDPFGYDEYNAQSGDVLGNQFRALVQQIQRTRGRVKLIITSRTSSLARAIRRTQLSDSAIEEFHIKLAPVEQALAQQVFYRHLSDSHRWTLSVVPGLIDGMVFENLLHASDCAYHLNRTSGEIARADLSRLFEGSRPSLYDKWLNRQPTELLFVLYAVLLVQEADQFSNRAAIHRIFTQLLACSPLPPAPGLQTHFDIGIDGLLEQRRIMFVGRNRIDFHHPLLRTATRQHFEQNLTDVSKLRCLIDGLVRVDEPLDQSIAAILALKFRERADIPTELLATIIQTRYVQVHDAFVRFGTDLLPLLSQPHDSDLRRLAREVYDHNYSPADCEIDQTGRLVLRQREDRHFRSMAEIADEVRWELPGSYPLFRIEPDLPARLDSCFAENDYSALNPLQRHAFVGYVVDRYEVEYRGKVIALLRDLSVDPTSFVRERVARQLVRLVRVEADPGLLETLRTLCFDSSPFVKIAALEKTILPIWALQPSGTQDELLSLVRDMLDDPVVRRRVARGIVNQSGSLAHYHEGHSPDQIRAWFLAVAHKLLQFDFQGDDLDRYLTALEQHYSSMDLDLRLTLLRDLEEYASRNPRQTAELAYTISNIVLHSNPGKEENAILIPLIGKLPNLARAKLCYIFAQEYDQLPDKSYAEFVQRPFYTEETNDYIVERAAGLLGFMANNSPHRPDLPPSLARLASDKSESIRKYLASESKELRLAVVFAAFGYGKLYAAAAFYDDMHRHPVVQDLVRNALTDTEDVRDRISVADVILRAAPSLMGTSGRPHHEWLDFVDLILNSDDTTLLKATCDMAFALNVGQRAHRRADWLRLLTRLLRHPRSEVRDYAFDLLDENYYSILVEQIVPAIHSDDRDLEGTVEWTNAEFVKYAMEHSPMLQAYLTAYSVLGHYEDDWPSVPMERRYQVVEFLRSLLTLSDYGLNNLVWDFVERMRAELPLEIVNEFEAAATRPHGSRRKVIGFDEQLQIERRSRDFSATFNWGRLLISE